MNTADIARLRLYNQQIVSTRLKKPEEVAAWLGGMQGQDYAGCKWSFGLRLPDATDADIEQAIACRTIIRTWPMRGTLHFVAAADVRWMLDLLAPRNIAGSARRHKQLELDESTFSRCRDIFIKALHGGRQLTRDDLYKLLEDAGISMNSQRGYHILWRSALDGIICFSAQRGRQQTFALLDECAPEAVKLPRGEALAELAKRYFNSRGPATLQDYMWWSGLAAADARAGLEMIKPQLEQKTVGGQVYWLPKDVSVPRYPSDIAHAFPGFDEYLLGYKDRSAALDSAHAAKVCPGGNGMFASTIAVNGRIIGIWKRTLKKKSVVITPAPFASMRQADKELFAGAAGRYANFLGLPVGDA